jgi:hypothetical protein
VNITVAVITTTPSKRLLSDFLTIKFEPDEMMPQSWLVP